MAEEDRDFKKIKELIKIMKDNDLIEAEIRHDDDKILLKRAGPQTIVAGPVAMPVTGPDIPTAPGAVPAGAQAAEKDNLTEIKSPMVGTFYTQANPETDAYVEAGSRINPGTVVCIIEAMKVMNEIKAETSGTIAEVLVANGAAVEFGQPLFKVKPE